MKKINLHLNTLKKENGITLIALVITIVVLLILARVSINAIFGNNGLIFKSIKAKVETEKAEITDMLSLSVNNIRMKTFESDDKSEKDYYKDVNTFLEHSNFDATISEKLDAEKRYIIWKYNFNEAENKVTLKISKKDGTGNKYEYEINILTGDTKLIGEEKDEEDDNNKQDIISKIEYKNVENKNFEETPVTEYSEGTIVGFSIPKKDGYAFDGWYQSEIFEGERVARTTKESTGKIVLYAKWIKESNPEYFTYSNSSITGLSETGENAYNNNEEDIINLVLPRKSNAGVEITSIGNNAFKGRTKIQTLIIHDNVTSIGSNTFQNCSTVSNLTIPISLDGGYYGSFIGCTGLTKINITKGTGEGINYSNTTSSITSYNRTPWYQSKENEIQIILEEEITKIGNYTFKGCTGMQLVELPTTLTTVGEGTFYGCTGMQGEINIGESITTIGTNAFDGCTGLTGKVIIPSGVTTISNYAFQSTKIQELVIHDNVTSIGSYAFRYCDALTSLTIPISLDGGYYGSFIGCTGLTKINITKGTGEGINYSNTTSSSTSYNRTPWYQSKENEIQIILEEGITKIGNYTFKGCTGMQLVELPTTLTTVGEGTFYGCTGMQGEMNIVESITAIGAYAFEGCTGLTGKILIPSGVTKISQNVFKSTSIQELVIHDNVTSIGSNAFQNCSTLTNLTIPISLDGGYYGSFIGCTGLTKINITKGTGEGINYSNTTSSSTSYNRTPWYQSKENEIQIILEEGITKIGNYTFKECTGMQLIELPTTLITIGEGTFYGCTGMQGEINLGESITAIGTNAFDGCTGLTGKVIIPSGVTTISNYAFQSTKIQELVIHDNVTSIGSYAFRYCNALTSLTIPISLDGGYYGSFIDCTGLIKINITKGTGEGINYSNTTSSATSYNRTPWYQSKDKQTQIILNSDITSIGNNTFLRINKCNILL